MDLHNTIKNLHLSLNLRPEIMNRNNYTPNIMESYPIIGRDQQEIRIMGIPICNLLKRIMDLHKNLQNKCLLTFMQALHLNTKALNNLLKQTLISPMVN